MPPIQDISSVGSFVPTTFIWDIQAIKNSNIPEEQKQLFVRLYQNINQIALVLNTKDSAYYFNTEFLNSQLFFPNPVLSSTSAKQPVPRQVYRSVVNFGALPNATSKSVAHNITVTNIPATSTAPAVITTFTRIYGAATNPATSFIPLPFSSPTLNENIKLEVDGTNVIITTAIDYSAYTYTYIILEYLKE